MVTAAPRGQSARHLGQTRDHSGPPSHQSPGRVLKGATCENTLPKEEVCTSWPSQTGCHLSSRPGNSAVACDLGQKTSGRIHSGGVAAAGSMLARRGPRRNGRAPHAAPARGRRQEAGGKTEQLWP